VRPLSPPESIMTAARSWAATADAIDKQAEDGRTEVVEDLKTRLN
jgi:hypothetical protein